MRQFIVRGFVMLALAVGLTVFVWYLLQVALTADSPETEVIEPIVPETAAPVAAEPEDIATNTAPAPAPTPVVTEPVVAAPVTPPNVEPEFQAINARDLPLSDAQKDAAAALGVDTETFVITPQMQQCAADTLGAERFAELVAGDTPGFAEGLALLGCLE